MLYSSITNIKWDYEDRRMVAGTVVAPGADDVKAFRLNPAEMSEVAIADALWAAVASR